MNGQHVRAIQLSKPFAGLRKPVTGDEGHAWQPQLPHDGVSRLLTIAKHLALEG